MKGMIELEICVLCVYNECDKLLKKVSMRTFISSSKLVYFPSFISMNLACIFLIDFHKNSLYIFTNEDS